MTHSQLSQRADVAVALCGRRTVVNSVFVSADSVQQDGDRAADVVTLFFLLSATGRIQCHFFFISPVVLAPRPSGAAVPKKDPPATNSAAFLR